MFFKMRALKNFVIFTGKTPVLESLFNKVAGLKAYNFIKKELEHRCFPIIFKNTFFCRTPPMDTFFLALLLL